MDQHVEVTDYHPIPVTYYQLHVKELDIMQELGYYGDLKQN